MINQLATRKAAAPRNGEVNVTKGGKSIPHQAQGDGNVTKESHFQG